MSWRSCLGVACVFVVALDILGLAARADAAQAAAAANAASAAVKASPELVSLLSKEIGATPEQAAGAAGAMFGVAKSRLKADEFSQISKAVPGMDLLLRAAPSTAASAAGSPSDALSQLAGTVGGIPAVASAFSKLGVKPEMAPKVASVLTSFVTKSGGANLGSLLAGVLK